MNSIECQTQLQIQCDIALIIKSLKQVMESKTYICSSENLKIACAFHLEFSGQVRLLKAQSELQLVWRFELQKGNLVLKIKVNSEGKWYASAIQDAINNNVVEICHSIRIANSLGSASNEGEFILTAKNNFFIYRALLPQFQLFKDPSKITHILSTKITLFTKIFIQQLQHIIFYYKVSGLYLHQLEISLEGKESKKLKHQIEKITYLKQCFQLHRQVRPNRTKCSLKGFKNKIIAETIKFTLKNSEKKVEENIKIKNTKLDQHESQFRKQVDQIKEQKQCGPIVMPCDFKKCEKERVLMKGGYGEIIFGMYHLMMEFTVNEQSNMEMIRRLSLSSVVTVEEMENCMLIIGLVKKTRIEKNTETECTSMQNEKKFLNCMRNNKCSQIANYFCQIQEKPFFQKDIYLLYYPSNLATSNLTFEARLAAMIDLATGLYFLIGKNIIHRDLKEHNIMIDKNGRAKIIDFGSVCGVWKTSSFEPVDARLRSTEGYYLSFKEASQISSSIEQKYSKEEFETSKFFDIYSFGVILENQFFLQSLTEENDFIRNNLKYLSLKCKEVNPEDRLSIEEVQIFLKSLLKFHNNRKKYWQKKEGLEEGSGCASEESHQNSESKEAQHLNQLNSMLLEL